MLEIAADAEARPELLHEAPLTRPVRRLDEVKATKTPVVRFTFGETEQKEA